MPSLMLRDVPAELFDEVRRYSRLRGLPGVPAGVVDLLRKGLAAAAAEDQAAAPAGPRVVVIPKQCRNCQGRFEIHCRHTPGVGVLSFWEVLCPYCQHTHRLELPGELLDSVKPPAANTADEP